MIGLIQLKTLNNLRMENSIVKQEQATPDQLLQMAVDKNLDVDKLGKLLELKSKWEAEQNRKFFFQSLGLFQSKAPDIRKSKKVMFETKTGGKTEYNYAPLDAIVRQIKDLCRECELTYRWEIQDSKEELSVTCIVTHSSGHSESTTMSSMPDTSGAKNPIQARGSAIEYLKRYTLIGALGLSTTDSDVDGVMPEIDIDILHRQYMTHFNELIQIDQKYAKWHPDEFKTERTAKLYIRAINAIRQELIKVTKKDV